jgi:hypothetical protein
MSQQLKCFISASYSTDISFVKNILAEYNIETIDIYDLTIGDSIQQILKRKIREADFALFVISNSESINVVYEMGVCEGIGKQHFIFLEKDFRVPSYLENQLFIRTDLKDRKFLKAAVEKILQAIRIEKSNKSSSIKQNKKVQLYNASIKEILVSCIEQIRKLRQSGTGREFERVIEEIFKTLNLPYVENETNKDKGVDFVLWNDELGKILGNPIIVEVKYGFLSEGTFKDAEKQINKYIEKTDSKVALLLYLDRNGNRYKIKQSLFPLVISYDVEDFATALLTNSFESLVLAQRNKIAHGID